MRRNLGQHSLTTQIIVSFVVLIIITTAITGVPAVWLIRGQSENQAWAQIEQGSRATNALLLALQKEVQGLTLVTAQRPSLTQLLTSAATDDLQAFLLTLQEGTDLDLLSICRPAGEMAAFIGDPALNGLCQADNVAGYYLAPASAASRFWLLATEPIDSEGQVFGFVITGIALDDAFATELQNQTGLNHILLFEDELLASSLPPAAARTASRLLSQANNAEFARSTFSLNGSPYYAIRLPLGQTDVVDEVALEATSIVANQRRLLGLMVTSIIFVATVGSILGVLLARRISLPLRQLTAAAASLSTGDLDTPVTVQARVPEIALVAQTLDTARADLQRTLGQLRQTNAWTDHLLDSVSEGIVVLDEEGRITFFSPAAEQITGYEEKAVLGQMANTIFHLDDTIQAFSDLLLPSSQPYKITLTLADQRQAVIDITSATLSLPSIGKAGTVLVFRDSSNTEQVHHLLSHFFAKITHEFRTPLATLIISGDLLLGQVQQMHHAELSELVHSLHLGILSLQMLIDNLLESANLEVGRFRVYPDPTQLGDVILEAVTKVKLLQERYHQKLRLELPEEMPTVQADARRTIQALVNLLINAIKYSPDGSEIVVIVTVVDNYVRVAVADGGSNIIEGNRPNLFRRLMQSSIEADHTQTGISLGLSVVKAIVEAQGGQTGYEDRVGGGVTFWFTIPRAKTL